MAFVSAKATAMCGFPINRPAARLRGPQRIQQGGRQGHRASVANRARVGKWCVTGVALNSALAVLSPAVAKPDIGETSSIGKGPTAPGDALTGANGFV